MAQFHYTDLSDQDAVFITMEDPPIEPVPATSVPPVTPSQSGTGFTSAVLSFWTSLQAFCVALFNFVVAWWPSKSTLTTWVLIGLIVAQSWGFKLPIPTPAQVWYVLGEAFRPTPAFKAGKHSRKPMLAALSKAAYAGQAATAAGATPQAIEAAVRSTFQTERDVVFNTNVAPVLNSILPANSQTMTPTQQILFEKAWGDYGAGVDWPLFLP